MGIGEQISRKKALDAATKAVEQCDLLTARHNETIEEVGKIRNGLAGLLENSTKRLDAQLEMIVASETRVGAVGEKIVGYENRALAVAHEVSRVEHKMADGVHQIRTTFANEQRHYVDTQDKATFDRAWHLVAAEVAARRHFERMGFFARLRWLFTGHVPAPKSERGMVSAVLRLSTPASGDEFEKFVRAHSGVPLRIVIEPRTNLLRLVTMDQTEVLEGAVVGNVFQPKR